ncbi:MAG TPA: 4Fe-4S dicluster domain-containing protein [Candidatus Binatia bacterium]|nr:4Fe-4S dicluster domain-containing protein [Candidatus Binatia bacterium]
MLGEQIIKGMAVTAKNFFESYVSKDRLTTVQYPEERLPQKHHTRQFPFLVYDGDDAQKGLRCVACQICEKECPPKCIYIVKSKDKKPDYKGQMQVYPVAFDIDISVCMSCQICVEVCPFESIKMDTQFELSNDNRFEALLLNKEQLSKPNSYYQKIHPEDAAESDAVIAAEKAKAEAKAKAAAEAKAKAEAEAKAKAAAVAATVPTTSTPAAPAPTTTSFTAK